VKFHSVMWQQCTGTQGHLSTLLSRRDQNFRNKEHEHVSCMANKIGALNFEVCQRLRARALMLQQIQFQRHTETLCGNRPVSQINSVPSAVTAMPDGNNELMS